VILLLRPQLGLPEIEPILLIVTRAIAGVLWLSIVAIIVDDIRSHAARVDELTHRIDALGRVLRAERDDAERLSGELQDQTLGALRRTIDEIARRLAGVADGFSVSTEAEALRRLIDDEVRPLSHELLQREVFAEEPPELGPRVRGRARLGFIVRLAVSTIAAPAWLAVLLPMALLLLFAVQRIGVTFTILVSLSYIVLVGASMLLARRLLDPVLPRLPVWAAALLVLTTYEVLAAITVINNWVWGDLSLIGRWVEWPTLFTLPAIWLGIAARNAAQSQRRDVEAHLEAVVAEYSLITARRRQRLRHEYQLVGRLLHGNVQSTLLAVSARIDRAAQATGAEHAAMLDAAARDLHELRDRIASPELEQWTAREALDDVFALWDQLLVVQLHCDTAMLARLDAAPATRSAVIDVVAEALTNAVRHGAARAVDVRLDSRPDGRLSVIVRDDGRASSAGAPGMGSRLLDAVAISWTLVGVEHGTELRVELSLDPHRGALPTRV
jgi:signal transduction histidine kinase